MKLRTEIQVPPFAFKLSHKHKLMMMGSCFVENMSDRLQSAGFRPDVNPFGVIYNPQSLLAGIRDLLSNRKYAASDLFEHQGVFHSFSHHSRFSGTCADDCLVKMNIRRDASSEFLRKADLLIITFGTAFVFTLKSNGAVVSNCHKLPDNLFTRSRLSVEEIREEWDDLIKQLRIFNPQLKILFTVSPIRHRKDGAHGNQLSKAILLLAIDELIQRNPECYYFPSYELVLDDLRDYRFYEEDMMHPSSQAINYIWGKFSSAFFDDTTRALIAEWQRIQEALRHKPFNPESKEYQEFLEKAQTRLLEFCKANPDFTTTDSLLFL